MARVDLPKGILAIHGRVGNLIYRSRKQPDGTYHVFVHEAPSRKHNHNRAAQTHPRAVLSVGRHDAAHQHLPPTRRTIRHVRRLYTANMQKKG